MDSDTTGWDPSRGHDEFLQLIVCYCVNDLDVRGNSGNIPWLQKGNGQPLVFCNALGKEWGMDLTGCEKVAQSCIGQMASVKAVKLSYSIPESLHLCYICQQKAHSTQQLIKDPLDMVLPFCMSM